jgi:hypothetical protein
MSTKKLIVNNESVGSIETDENNIITSVFIHKTSDRSLNDNLNLIGIEDNLDTDYYKIEI